MPRLAMDWRGIDLRGGNAIDSGLDVVSLHYMWEKGNCHRLRSLGSRISF